MARTAPRSPPNIAGSAWSRGCEPGRTGSHSFAAPLVKNRGSGSTFFWGAVRQQCIIGIHLAPRRHRRFRRRRCPPEGKFSVVPMQANAAGRLGLARTSGAMNQEAVMKHVIHALFLALIGTCSSAWSQEIGTREVDEIGRAHVCTPVPNAHLVCRLLIGTKK